MFLDQDNTASCQASHQKDAIQYRNIGIRVPDLSTHRHHPDFQKRGSQELQDLETTPEKNKVSIGPVSTSTRNSRTVNAVHSGKVPETPGTSKKEVETQVQVIIEFHQILGIMRVLRLLKEKQKLRIIDQGEVQLDHVKNLEVGLIEAYHQKLKR